MIPAGSGNHAYMTERIYLQIGHMHQHSEDVYLNRQDKRIHF